MKTAESAPASKIFQLRKKPDFLENAVYCFYKTFVSSTKEFQEKTFSLEDRFVFMLL